MEYERETKHDNEYICTKCDVSYHHMHCLLTLLLPACAFWSMMYVSRQQKCCLGHASTCFDASRWSHLFCRASTWRIGTSSYVTISVFITFIHSSVLYIYTRPLRQKCIHVWNSGFSSKLNVFSVRVASWILLNTFTWFSDCHASASSILPRPRQCCLGLGLVKTALPTSLLLIHLTSSSPSLR